MWWSVAKENTLRAARNVRKTVLGFIFRSSLVGDGAQPVRSDELENAHLEIAALTHPGMTGKNNEDRYGVTAYTDPNGKRVVFAMVADGVGGKQAGEIAAQIAVDTIVRAATESDGTDPVGTLQAAYHESNQAIREKAAEGIETSGMATTATCAWVFEDRLYAANIGNSRLYLHRAGKLRRISIDHSWVEEAIQHGVITEEQGENHPNARIITRALGMKDAEPDVRIQLSRDDDEDQMVANQGMPLEVGDILLICSDGLSDVVRDPEIEAALNEVDLQEALSRLTDLANARGGPDNITSVALRVPEKPVAAVTPPREATSLGRLGNYLLSTVLLVALVIAGWLIYLMFLQ